MKLFHSPTSPFVRKVMVLIHEADIRGVGLIASAGNPVDPGSMPVDHNPLGKVPALLPGDGPAIYDSRVICRYLNDRANAGLYPPAPRLWDTLTLEATADGMLDAAVLMVYEQRIRPDAYRYGPWIEGQWAKVGRALDALESRWMAHLNGPMDMGHIAIGCALGYLDFRHGARDWRTARPALTAWYQGFSLRPSMQATVPQG